MDNNNQGDSHNQGNFKKNKKINLESSPDSEKFDKYLDELMRTAKDIPNNENILLKVFSFFSDISKKNKYQLRIIETQLITDKIKEILLKFTNTELSLELTKIILNISKSHNNQKLIFETSLNFNTLFEILLMNLNTNLTYNLLLSFLYLTESKDILDKYMTTKKKKTNFLHLKTTVHFLKEESADINTQTNQIFSKLDLKTITRTFSEKILDELIASNKKIVLKILANLYNYNETFLTKEAIEPLIRCLGNKSNDVVINALKILLFFTKNKSFHNDLLNANFIFRLVRTYKQGIDEIDMVIVKILYDLFNNKNLYEILFENNVLLILSNYLINFEVEKNEGYEEVIRNVFEIIKLINKNTEEDNNKTNHFLQSTSVFDENLQSLIFQKAYSLVTFSKNESTILSCLSLLEIMLSKFSLVLLNSEDNIKSIIELVPPFFRSKNIDIIKYSLSIFDIILNKKYLYFEQTYIQSANQTFSIKSLVHSIINLVNEYSSNYEILSMSCQIFVILSNITRLQPYFLQEPQITVLKVFNDNLLKRQRQLKKEKINLEERLNSYPKNINNNNDNNIYDNYKKYKSDHFKIGEGMTPIDEKNEKDNDNDEDENIIISNLDKNNKKNNNGILKSKFRSGNLDNIRPNEFRKLSANNTSNYNNSVSTSKNEEKDRYYLNQINKRIQENINLVKDSFSIISNLAKNEENLEILTLKGFLDIIAEKLDDNDSDILPYITRCIQGFCQAQSSIDIILKMQIINKILNTYKLYNIDEEHEQEQENQKVRLDSSRDVNNIKTSIWSLAAKRLEVLKCLKNILENDIKLQRAFIIEKGIEILMKDIINDNANVSEIISVQINEMILRVIHVVSCNINKLFLKYYDSEKNNKNDIMYNFSSESDSDNIDDKLEININSKKLRTSKINKIQIQLDMESDNSLYREETNEINNENIFDDLDNKTSKILKLFKEQLSEKKLMLKLIEIGEYDSNKLTTYIELIKIFINLYLNRYYLKYFTSPKVFDKVINIINIIIKKLKEEKSEKDGEILKLILIFLKFICEDENLIHKFMKENVLLTLIETIIESDFKEKMKKEEINQFYYDLSFVILRLTEIKGFTNKLKLIQNFLQTLEKLYDINLINGKIYILSIIRNIISEDPSFFDETELSKFLEEITTQKSGFIIYEFVELIKILVYSKTMCKKMKKVFKFLLKEISSINYSFDFKKKILDLILCLSYEKENIEDYTLEELLLLIKNLDININKKTTLLIMMNFSSIASNFNYLKEDYKINYSYNDARRDLNLNKNKFNELVNQMIDSDKFSQILVQRLLINITSIDGIDMGIINEKMIKILLDIIIKQQTFDETKIIFALAILINISNKNVFKLQTYEESRITSRKDIVNIKKKSNNMLKTESNKNLNSSNKKGMILLRNESADSVVESSQLSLSDNLKERNFVLIDYIFEKIKNFKNIIKDLLDKGSLDISSLTIIFCINILRKLKASKYSNNEKEIRKIIENYIKNEKILNSKDIGESLVKNENGRFLLISIIKFYTSLSIEGTSHKLHTSIIPKIIMKVLKNNSSDNNKLKLFKIDINDIKDNSINFALVESQLTFLNLILLLGKKKESTYYYGYESYEELRENILIFFEDFINNFSELLHDFQESEIQSTNKENDDEENSEYNELVSNKKNDIENKEKNNYNEIINKDNKSISEEENSKFKNNNLMKRYNIRKNDIFLLKNQIIQNILISCFKILIEYLINFDYYLEKDKNKTISDDLDLEDFTERDKIFKRDMNIEFYNKIYPAFKKIINCFLEEPPIYLYEELKDILIYILFIILSNFSEIKEDSKNDLNEDLTMMNPDIENNLNFQNWLMDIFIASKKSIHNDYFCLKIFTIFVQKKIFLGIFYQNSKFIKKLILYLKYSGLDKRKRIIKSECERFLNIISFDPKSHNVLYSMGVYSIFKYNLFNKVSNNQISNENNNSICKKEDFILLINIILNKKNIEYIKDDIKRILINIFPSKELSNTLRVELFDIYMNTAFDLQEGKQFQEDYSIIFNLLYQKLRTSFSEMIFLLDKFTKKYPNFIKNFLFEGKIIIKIFYDFLKFDTNFPSKSEELISYLKILELYLEVGEIPEDLENMIKDFMTAVTKDEVRDNLKDINIVHSILNFSFLFFLRFCEIKNLIPEDEDNNKDKKIKDNDDERSSDSNEEEDEDSFESSYENNKFKLKHEINYKFKEKMKEFIIKYKYSKLIDNIIYNALNSNEYKGAYILSMLIIQDDYKSMLLPLKEIGSQLFSKNYILAFFTKFIDFKKFDIKEFVFWINLTIVLSNINKGECDFMGYIINEIIDIYKKYLVKILINSRNLIYGMSITSSNINDNSNNGEDNGARINNGGGGLDNGIGMGNGAGNQNLENTIGPRGESNNNFNQFNEIVCSIYFFCDLVKSNEINISVIKNVLDFMIFIISDVKNLSIEQKEILIRYYQEILLRYKINTDEELGNLFKFLNKIHNDKAINFIENLIFGTILINTRKDILLNNINEFLNIVSLICFNNENDLIDIDKNTLITYYKLCKQICVILDFNTKYNRNINRNGFNERATDNKIQIAFYNLESYVNKTIANSIQKIKNDDELFKKFEKINSMIQSCIKA